MNCNIFITLISEYEAYEPGTTFSEHPTSDIILPNQTITDQNDEKTVTMYFDYNAGDDCWYAKNIYDFLHLTGDYLDNLILTRDEVNTLDVDCNTNVAPEHVYIYNGSAKPGTPF